MDTYQAGAAADQSVQRCGPNANRNAAMPMRILIVENERILAKNLRAYLSRSAADVRTAGNGEQAIEMLDTFTPDALLVDYGLPGIDGLQTYIEIVRRRGSEIDCVMITGNPNEPLVRAACETGIRHIVCKPFRFSELQRLLEVPARGGADDHSAAGTSIRGRGQ